MVKVDQLTTNREILELWKRQNFVQPVVVLHKMSQCSLQNFVSPFNLVQYVTEKINFDCSIPA